MGDLSLFTQVSPISDLQQDLSSPLLQRLCRAVVRNRSVHQLPLGSSTLLNNPLILDAISQIHFAAKSVK